jgi:peptidoglycan hydrolase-like protein with peptidoglycan-binding domain
MSGSDVVLLQKFLIEKGYLTPGNDSGFFGLQTEWAVKQYQSKRGIASYGTGDTTGYGVVGLKTRQAINNSLPNTSVQTTTSSSSSSLSSGSSNFYRDLTLGSQGQDVLALQVFLNNHGFSVAWSGAGSAGQETNYFGNATKAALAKYQSSVGIRPASGNFGPITRAYIGNFAQ